MSYLDEAQNGLAKQPGIEPTVASQESLMTKASVGGTWSRSGRSQASKRKALP